MKSLVIKDISELKKSMTEEQKKKAQADFEKYYPKGTPEIMCTSEESISLTKVNVDDFDQEYEETACEDRLTGTIEIMKVKV